ncbi:dCTP deaminase [Nitrososphaera sp.]|uniref:dCTP deaminase n=1 Tax=Nitrososphaera sp. TaxID=1971748 RepID=UPI00307E43A4
MSASNQIKKGEMPSKEDLQRRLNLDGASPEKLVVTPLINPDKQIEDGTIDLRLSTEFVVAKRSKFATLDPLDEKGNMDSRILEYQEKAYVKIGHKLILHPQQFALGATFEYIKMPVDLIGYVLGRSSWGRLGLLIATATVVHPGYAGIITLELTNLGDTPITLYPGTRIAQLALHQVSMTEEERKKKLDEAQQAKTKYKASVSPIFSRVHQDSEWPMIKSIRDSQLKKE